MAARGLPPRPVIHFGYDHRGGVESVLQTFASRGIDLPQAFVLWPRTPSETPLSDALRALGADVRRAGTGPLQRLRTYRRHLNRGDCIAVAHYESDVVWSAVGHRLGVCPHTRWVVVKHVTGNLTQPSPTWLGEWSRLVMEGYRRADTVVAVGPEVAGELRDLGLGCVEIRSPVDLERLQAVPPPQAPARRFLFMARLEDPRKDLATVVRALARTRTPGLSLSVAGDGPLRSGYEALTRTLGVADRVHFLGWRRPEEALAGADTLVLSTTYPEGYALVGAEAAAAGRPLLFNRRPAISHFADVGWGFETEDPESLALLMDRVALLSAAEFAAASQRAIAWSRHHHDPAVWRQRWIEVFQRLR